MPDWDSLMARAKEDVLASVEAWTTVLSETLGNWLSYAYAKGSALKRWDSPIDYVPVLSDVDIHINLKQDASLFYSSEDPFSDALHMSRSYEREFLMRKPEHLHVPRSQVIVLDKLVKLVDFVPADLDKVRVLIGDPPQDELPAAERIREIDLKNILQLEEFLERMPHRVSDRVGMDFWQLIREMAFRVSPTPVRLLSQTHDSPLELWSLNRTRICEALETEGYTEISKHYRGFYEQGWELFLSGFTDLDAFRETTRNGYYVLNLCLEAARESC
jgi:hypothetical protein